MEVVGAHGSHGSFLPIESCPAWRRAVNDGGFQYVVISPRLITRDDTGLTLGSIFGRVTPELDWTRTERAAKQIAEFPQGPMYVYELNWPHGSRGLSARRRKASE